MYDHSEHVKDYRKRLTAKICEYMQMSVNDDSAIAIGAMLDTLEKVDKYAAGGAVERLKPECLMHWNQSMKNADGTTGGHWTVEETRRVAESMNIYFEHITPEEWNATMNSIYSDYALVARKAGTDNAGFYADMAKAFLFDRDGGKPSIKLAEYYNCIVKPAMY